MSILGRLRGMSSLAAGGAALLLALSVAAVGAASGMHQPRVLGQQAMRVAPPDATVRPLGPTELLATIGQSTACAGGFCTVTGSAGYQFQVPSDWQSAEGVDDSMDLEFHSPDEEASVVITLPSGAVTDPLEIIRAQVSDMHADDSLAKVSAGRPERVLVANADAAAVITVIYVDAEETEQGEILLVAVRGSTVYVLDLMVTRSYLEQHTEQLQQIVTSFQLIP